MINERRRRGQRLRAPAELLSHKIALVVLTLVSAGLLLLSRADSTAFDQIRTTFDDVTTPVFDAFAEPVHAVGEWFGNLDAYFTVHDDNERLREENARLMEWKNVALALEQKVTRYEALLNFQGPPSAQMITAQVVADTGGPFVRAFVVSAGADAGAVKGQAVVDGEGLLGRVIEVGRRSARVLLVTDLNSRIPVIIEPYDFRAMLIGDNTGSPRLEYLPPGVTVNVGDRIVTSGDGGVFPPGLPVGTVAGGDGRPHRVILFANENGADVVRLLRYEFPIKLEPAAEPAPADGTAPAGDASGAASAPGGDQPVAEAAPTAAAPEPTRPETATPSPTAPATGTGG